MENWQIALGFFAFGMLTLAIVRSIRTKQKCQQVEERPMTFEDVLEKRAKKFGMTPQEYLDSMETPRWIQLAQKRAESEGKTLDQFLEERKTL